MRIKKTASWRKRVFFKLAEVAVFDLLHQGLALEEIGAEISGELAGDDENLIVNHLGKRDGTAHRDEVRTPLEHEANVPEEEGGEECGSNGKSGAMGTEGLRGAIEENGEAED